MKMQLLTPLLLTLTLLACKEEEDGSRLRGMAMEASAVVNCSGVGLDGAGMYAEHCADCHDRIDGARIGPNLVYAMPHHSDGFVLETINDGAGTMPAYEDILSCDEQLALLDYLREEYGECDASLWDWCD